MNLLISHKVEVVKSTQPPFDPVLERTGCWQPVRERGGTRGFFLASHRVQLRDLRLNIISLRGSIYLYFLFSPLSFRNNKWKLFDVLFDKIMKGSLQVTSHASSPFPQLREKVLVGEGLQVCSQISSNIVCKTIIFVISLKDIFRTAFSLSVLCVN